MSGEEQRAHDAEDPVRWLLLDVGGVLEIVDYERWPSRFRARWARRLGFSDTEFTRRLEAGGLPDTRTRTGIEGVFWERYGGALGASAAVLAEMRADFWDEYCGIANSELLDAVQRLRGSVGLAILSNSGDGAREEEERRYGFAAVFDPICYSHELGVSKPDPLAFQLALGRMRAAPADVLFIDDRAPNIGAARRLGLRAHLHVSNAETLAGIGAWVRR